MAILNDERMLQFVDWFGKSVEINDCDPALYMINYFFDRFEFNREQKYWLSWIYGTTYNFPTAYVIWNEFPDFELVGQERLDTWNDANYSQLRYQTDTKWNKGHLPAQFKSYKNWVSNQTQHERFQSLMTGDERVDFDILNKEVKSWFKFGRYMSWFYLQTLKHCVGVKINPDSLLLHDYDGSRSHRNGLCYALGEDHLIDKKLNPSQLDTFDVAAASMLTLTKRKFPKIADKLDYFAMETCLCSFKKLFRVKRGRYLGYYHDRQAEEITKAEGDGWTGINWNPLWQARNETVQSQYLNDTISTEKMKLFLSEHPQKPRANLTMIAGLPATGKTTLMRHIRTGLGKGLPCGVGTKGKCGLLNYEAFPNHVILGYYDDASTFAGTDKLSMAVNPDALKFLKSNTKDVLVEGDRLFNMKFLDGAKALGYDVRIKLCQVVGMPELLRRYKQRGKMQSQSFIKGRHTKICNITNHYPTDCIDTTHPLPMEEIKSLIPMVTN